MGFERIAQDSPHACFKYLFVFFGKKIYICFETR